MLEGDLGDFALPDILRLLASTSKTGRLRLHVDGALGRVDMHGGLVGDASADAAHLPVARRLLGLGLVDVGTLGSILDDRDQLPTDREVVRALITAGGADEAAVTEVLREQAVDAVFDLLRWRYGSFRFDAGADPEPPPPELTLPVDEVLRAAEDRLGSWPDIEARTGAGDAVVAISRPAAGRSPLDVDPDGWALLSLVDGRRTVDELVELTGRGQYDTRRTLGALVDQDVVRIGESGSGSHVERLLEAHRMLAAREDALRSAPAAAPAPPAARPAAPDQPVAQDRPGTQGQPPAPPPEPAPAPQRVADGSAPAQPHEAELDIEALVDVRRPEVTELRPRARRLTTDPSVDSELVSRLIDGVEGL